MCLAIPSIIVSDFTQIGVDLSLICGLNFSPYLCKSSRPYVVVFLALGMFHFCEIPCKHLQNKNFPPSCCFHFDNHGLLRIVHG